MSQIYKITYFNHSSVYEIYAKEVYQSDMYGFIVVEDLVFGENASIVVDPSEEKLKTEFANVKRFFVPAHNICLLYTSPSPRDVEESRMPSSA